MPGKLVQYTEIIIVNDINTMETLLADWRKADIQDYYLIHCANFSGIPLIFLSALVYSPFLFTPMTNSPPSMYKYINKQ